MAKPNFIELPGCEPILILHKGGPSERHGKSGEDRQTAFPNGLARARFARTAKNGMAEAVKIESLKRVNLITGQNNTGKTGLLEALVLLLDESAQNQHLRSRLPNLFRTVGGDYNENFWKWLFNNKNSEKPIEIETTGFTGGDFGAHLKNKKRTGRLLEKVRPKVLGICFRAK